MIEVVEDFLSQPVSSSGSKMARELARRILREDEHKEGQRPVIRAQKGKAEKRPKGHKGAVKPGELTPAEAAVVITERHRALWDKVSRKLDVGLKKTDPKEGLERLKVVKLAGDILSVVVRGQRQAWGLEALEGLSDRDVVLNIKVAG